MITAQQQAVRALRLMMAACVAAPLGVAVYAGWALDRDLLAASNQKIENQLEVLEQHTAKAFEAAELALYTTGLLTNDLTDEEIVSRDAILQQRLHDIVSKLPELQSIWLFSRDGETLTSSFTPTPRVSVRDRDYFAALAAADVGLYVSATHAPKAAQTGSDFFAFARRRHSATGRFEGVIDVSLLPSDFEQFYRQLNPAGHELFGMVRRDGAVLARYPAAPVPVSQLQPTQSPLLRAITEHPEGGGFTAVSPLDGIDRLVAFRPVAGYPVYLFAGIETATIRAHWLSTLASYLAVGVPAEMLLILALSITIRRTRRLYVEAERRQAAELALTRAQRLEAIGQLTGGVAHDFNNLLMIIGGNAERLRRNTTAARDRRSLDMIASAVERGAALTRQLLTFARRQALSVEVVDIARHVGEFVEMMRRSMRGDIEIVVDAPESPCLAKVDPGEFELALLNIAVNARDAMPDGGRLTLRVRAVVLDGGESVAGLRGDFVSVTLEDNGVGIPAEVLPRVYEPFFTTKETDKGTGLGLSQVYGFARQSGGVATIASEVGRGTAVTLFLPITTEPPSDPARKSKGQAASGAGRRVLVVDDNADVADVLRGMLQDLGFAVETARCGRAALDRLAEDNAFDAVLSDIVMPGEVNGLDLAREARRLHPGLTVVLTSGYSASSELAIREGFILLRKPYQAERLRAVMQEALSR